MLKKIRNNKRKILVVSLLVVCLFALFATGAMATIAQSDQNAPWEKALVAFAESVKGPVAASIAVLMFAACVWGVIRGAELSTWVAPTAIAALAVATLANVDKVLRFIGVDAALLM